MLTLCNLLGFPMDLLLDVVHRADVLLGMSLELVAHHFGWRWARKLLPGGFDHLLFDSYQSQIFEVVEYRDEGALVHFAHSRVFFLFDDVCFEACESVHFLIEAVEYPYVPHELTGRTLPLALLLLADARGVLLNLGVD